MLQIILQWGIQYVQLVGYVTAVEAVLKSPTTPVNDTLKLQMWANAQRDGRPAEYRWRPLFNAAKFG